MGILGESGIEVSPLCFGGNVFSWTIDRDESYRVLDRYVAAGGNFIDTADTYTAWMEGHQGGESEAILGGWLRSRGNRDRVVVATKVGQKPDRRGMAPETVRMAVEESLRRLEVDAVDLLYAHIDDPSVPLIDTLAVLDAFVREGKARTIGASNYTAPRFREALEIQEREHLARFTVLQPHYNLLRRDIFEGELQEICVAEGVACAPHSSLANGALTGKYRGADDTRGSARERYMAGYFARPEASQILTTLAEVAARHGVSMAATALAWLAGRPAVVAPIVSARTPEQFDELVPMLDLELDTEDLGRLESVSRPE